MDGRGENGWLGAGKGMLPLYDLTNAFSGSLQSKSVAQMVDDYDIKEITDFSEHWQDLLLVALGFCICAGLGILLVIVLPITGCGICCRKTCCRCKCCCKRCCGCCKPKLGSQPKGKKWSCKRTGFSITLSILAATMFASVVCSFVALEQLQYQVSPYGFMDGILKGLYAVDDYVADTTDDVNVVVVNNVETSTDDAIVSLDNFPNDVTTALGQNAGVYPALTYLVDFVNNLTNLDYALGNMTDLRLSLQAQSGTLDSDLTSSRAALQNILLAFNIPAYPNCQQAFRDLLLVRPLANYTNLDDVTPAQNAVSVAISGGIIDDVNKGVDNFTQIVDKVEAEAAGSVNDSKQSIQDAATKATEQITSTMDQLRATLNLTGLEKTLWAAKPDVNYYGSMAVYCLNGVSSVLLVIVTCMGIGIILGLVCKSPAAAGPGGACSATSEHGARLLLASVGLSFVFVWLLALTSALLLIIGGVVENNLCRPLVYYDDSMVALERLAKDQVGLTYNISLKSAMEDCKANSSLYTSMNMEANGFNITNATDLTQYGVYDSIDELRNISVDIGEVTILYPGVNETMFVLDASLSQIDFDSYDLALKDNITATSLEDYAGVLLKKAANEIDPVNSSLAQELRVEAAALLNLSATLVVDMELERQSLAVEVAVAKSIVLTIDLPVVMANLSNAEYLLNTQGNAMTSAVINQQADDLTLTMQTMSRAIDDGVRTDVGNCRSLYDSGVDTVDSVCIYSLYPTNALWFCYGWFLCFSIPAVAFANELAGIFRATTDAAEGTADPAAMKTNKVSPESSPYVVDEEFALNYTNSKNNIYPPLTTKPPDSTTYPNAKPKDETDYLRSSESGF